MEEGTEHRVGRVRKGTTSQREVVEDVPGGGHDGGVNEEGGGWGTPRGTTKEGLGEASYGGGALVVGPREGRS